jgi:ATP-dependent exoDNAse (exonuclease V) beta subunit
VSSFAVMLSSKPVSADGILLLVDERGDAEAIANELRRRGQPVTVREIKGPDRQFHNPAAPPPSNRPGR